MAKSIKIVLNDVRASYPHLFSPDTMSGKYTCDFIVAKNHPQLAQLKAALKAAADDAKLNNPGKPLDAAKVLRDGDLEKPGEEAFNNAYFVKAKSNICPKDKVYKRLETGAVAQITDESELYGGCNCSASLLVSWYEFQGKIGVHVILCGVCKEQGGEALGANNGSAADFARGESTEEEEIY